MTPKEFQRRQEENNRQRQLRDRAAGGLEQVMKNIKETWDCKNITEAEKILAKLDKEVSKSERDVEEEAEAYDQEFPERYHG